MEVLSPMKSSLSTFRVSWELWRPFNANFQTWKQTTINWFVHSRGFVSFMVANELAWRFFPTFNWSSYFIIFCWSFVKSLFSCRNILSCFLEVFISASIQVRNLRIGAMLKTVLHALAQAVFISSSLNMYKEGMVANLKEKLQVQVLCFCNDILVFYMGVHFISCIP